MRVLGVIPARGGSRGVPRKNVRLLGGRPLLAYTAEAALAASRLSRVVLTTDDEEIAATGRALGLDVPFLRPVELADDRAAMLPVVQHAVRTLEQAGDAFDAVCLLQPTSPFRRADDIDACIELLDVRRADAVVTVRPVPVEFNPHWVFEQSGEGWLHVSTGEAALLTRRQDLPPAFYRDGSVYVTRRDVLIESNSLYGERLLGQVMTSEPAVNIDTPEDWARAEVLLRSVRSDE